MTIKNILNYLSIGGVITIIGWFIKPYIEKILKLKKLRIDKFIVNNTKKCLTLDVTIRNPTNSIATLSQFKFLSKEVNEQMNKFRELSYTEITTVYKVKYLKNKGEVKVKLKDGTSYKAVGIQTSKAHYFTADLFQNIQPQKVDRIQISVDKNFIKNTHNIIELEITYKIGLKENKLNSISKIIN